MDTFLRPKEIAAKLGISNGLAGKIIGKSKCREKKVEGEKTVFCYEDVVDYIRRNA